MPERGRLPSSLGLHRVENDDASGRDSICRRIRSHVPNRGSDSSSSGASTFGTGTSVGGLSLLPQTTALAPFGGQRTIGRGRGGREYTVFGGLRDALLHDSHAGFKQV